MFFPFTHIRLQLPLEDIKEMVQGRGNGADPCFTEIMGFGGFDRIGDGTLAGSQSFPAQHSRRWRRNRTTYDDAPLPAESDRRA